MVRRSHSRPAGPVPSSSWEVPGWSVCSVDLTRRCHSRATREGLRIGACRSSARSAPWTRLRGRPSFEPSWSAPSSWSAATFLAYLVFGTGLLTRLHADRPGDHGTARHRGPGLDIRAHRSGRIRGRRPGTGRLGRRARRRPPAAARRPRSGSATGSPTTMRSPRESGCRTAAASSPRSSSGRSGPPSSRSCRRRVPSSARDRGAGTSASRTAGST